MLHSTVQAGSSALSEQELEAATQLVDGVSGPTGLAAYAEAPGGVQSEAIAQVALQLLSSSSAAASGVSGGAGKGAEATTQTLVALLELLDGHTVLSARAVVAMGEVCSRFLSADVERIKDVWGRKDPTTYDAWLQVAALGQRARVAEKQLKGHVDAVKQLRAFLNQSNGVQGDQLKELDAVRKELQTITGQNDTCASTLLDILGPVPGGDRSCASAQAAANIILTKLSAAEQALRAQTEAFEANKLTSAEALVAAAAELAAAQVRHQAETRKVSETLARKEAEAAITSEALMNEGKKVEEKNRAVQDKTHQLLEAAAIVDTNNRALDHERAKCAEKRAALESELAACAADAVARASGFEAASARRDNALRTAVQGAQSAQQASVNHASALEQTLHEAQAAHSMAAAEAAARAAEALREVHATHARELAETAQHKQSQYDTCTTSLREILKPPPADVCGTSNAAVRRIQDLEARLADVRKAAEDARGASMTASTAAHEQQRLTEQRQAEAIKQLRRENEARIAEVRAASETLAQKEAEAVITSAALVHKGKEMEEMNTSVQDKTQQLLAAVATVESKDMQLDQERAECAEKRAALDRELEACAANGVARALQFEAASAVTGNRDTALTREIQDALSAQKNSVDRASALERELREARAAHARATEESAAQMAEALQEARAAHARELAETAQHKQSQYDTCTTSLREILEPAPADVCGTSTAAVQRIQVLEARLANVRKAAEDARGASMTASTAAHEQQRLTEQRHTEAIAQLRRENEARIAEVHTSSRDAWLQTETQFFRDREQHCGAQLAAAAAQHAAAMANAQEQMRQQADAMAKLTAEVQTHKVEVNMLESQHLKVTTEQMTKKNTADDCVGSLRQILQPPLDLPLDSFAATCAVTEAAARELAHLRAEHRDAIRELRAEKAAVAEQQQTLLAQREAELQALRSAHAADNADTGRARGEALEAAGRYRLLLADIVQKISGKELSSMSTHMDATAIARGHFDAHVMADDERRMQLGVLKNQIDSIGIAVGCQQTPCAILDLVRAKEAATRISEAGYRTTLESVKRQLQAAQPAVALAEKLCPKLEGQPMQEYIEKHLKAVTSNGVVLTLEQLGTVARNMIEYRKVLIQMATKAFGAATVDNTKEVLVEVKRAYEQYVAREKQKRAEEAAGCEARLNVARIESERARIEFERARSESERATVETVRRERAAALEQATERLETLRTVLGCMGNMDCSKHAGNLMNILAPLPPHKDPVERATGLVALETAIKDLLQLKSAVEVSEVLLQLKAWEATTRAAARNGLTIEVGKMQKAAEAATTRAKAAATAAASTAKAEVKLAVDAATAATQGAKAAEQEARAAAQGAKAVEQAARAAEREAKAAEQEARAAAQGAKAVEQAARAAEREAKAAEQEARAAEQGAKAAEQEAKTQLNALRSALGCGSGAAADCARRANALMDLLGPALSANDPVQRARDLVDTETVVKKNMEASRSQTGQGLASQVEVWWVAQNAKVAQLAKELQAAVARTSQRDPTLEQVVEAMAALIGFPTPLLAVPTVQALISKVQLLNVFGDAAVQYVPPTSTKGRAQWTSNKTNQVSLANLINSLRQEIKSLHQQHADVVTTNDKLTGHIRDLELTSHVGAVGFVCAAYLAKKVEESTITQFLKFVTRGDPATVTCTDMSIEVGPKKEFIVKCRQKEIARVSSISTDGLITAALEGATCLQRLQTATDELVTFKATHSATIKDLQTQVAQATLRINPNADNLEKFAIRAAAMLRAIRTAEKQPAKLSMKTVTADTLTFNDNTTVSVAPGTWVYYPDSIAQAMRPIKPQTYFSGYLRATNTQTDPFTSAVRAALGDLTQLTRAEWAECVIRKVTDDLRNIRRPDPATHAVYRELEDAVTLIMDTTGQNIAVFRGECPPHPLTRT